MDKANERAAAAAEDARRAAAATAQANEDARIAIALANEDARLAAAATAQANEDARRATAAAADAIAKANERADAAAEDTRRAAEDTRRAYSIIETAVNTMSDMVSMSRQNLTNVRGIRAAETSVAKYIKNEDTPTPKRFVCVSFERDDDAIVAHFIDTDSLTETEAIADCRPSTKRTRSICAANAFETEEVVRVVGNQMLKKRKIESVS